MARQVVRVRVRGRVQWAVTRDPDSGEYLARCGTLDLVVGAETLNELALTIAEGMDALFETLVAEGQLEHFLRQRGWTTEQPVPTNVAAHDLAIDVPWELLDDANRQLPSRC